MFPGQFPDDRLYNLDFRDEDFWYFKALRKLFIAELRLIQSINLGAWGKEQYMERQEQLLDALAALEGIDRPGQRHVENWNYIKAKGRG